MRTIINYVTLCCFALLVAGCSTTITNLSPSQQVRNATGLYHLEVAWDSAQHSVVSDSLKAYVMVGMEMYPMQPTPMVKDRWETLVPVPADQNLLHYRYKFEFDYLSMPQRRQDSRLSDPYTLKILDR